APTSASPIASPQPIVHRNAGITPAALGLAPAAIAERIAKPTAATPSLSRLSDSTTIDTRGRQPISRNEAMTETGSVAAISTPNRLAPIQLQPATQCIPEATTAAAIPTPKNASVRV